MALTLSYCSLLPPIDPAQDSAPILEPVPEPTIEQLPSYADQLSTEKRNVLIRVLSSYNWRATETNNTVTYFSFRVDDNGMIASLSENVAITSTSPEYYLTESERGYKLNLKKGLSYMKFELDEDDKLILIVNKGEGSDSYWMTSTGKNVIADDDE